MIGKTPGHYRIVEKPGVGGMGVVYHVEDRTLDRYVAIKVVPRDAQCALPCMFPGGNSGL